MEADKIVVVVSVEKSLHLWCVEEVLARGFLRIRKSFAGCLCIAGVIARHDQVNPEVFMKPLKLPVWPSIASTVTGGLNS